MHVDVRRRTSTCINVLQMLSYVPSVRRRSLCVNAAVEINVLDYNVTVRRRSVNGVFLS